MLDAGMADAAGGPGFDPSVREQSHPTGPHVARTLGWRRGGWSRGQAELHWTATADHCSAGRDGPEVVRGLLCALVDSVMASAAYTLAGPEHRMATADLCVSFLHPVAPGELVALGWADTGPRAARCRGQVTDATGRVVVTASATQV